LAYAQLISLILAKEIFMKKIWLCCLLVVVIILSGCGQGKTSLSDLQVTIYPQSSYPQPGVDSEILTAYPAYPTFEPYPFKTSQPGTVTIHGILLIYNPHLARPIEDGLFLVPLTGDETVTTIPDFQVGEVPQAEIDERTGEFFFTNVLPGRYIIVVLTTGKMRIPAFNFEDDTYVVVFVEETDIDKTIELNYIRLP